MGVRAAEPERAESRAERQGRAIGVHGPPFARPVRQRERGAVQAKMRVGGVPDGVGRQCAVLDGEQHLEQPGDSGRRLQMADVGFDRAQLAPGGLAFGRPAEGRGQAGDLDGVTEPGAGAVRLDVADGARIDAGTGEGGGDDLGLRLGARCGQ